jgi:ketosteroid isomerase-like protein
MRQGLFGCAAILLFASCAHTQQPGRSSSQVRPSETGYVSTAAVAQTLLGLSQEWVDTWNQQDVDRMAEMYGDVTRTFYVIGETFSTVEWLLREIREKKFWNLSWKIRIVEPHVRILAADAGLVSFRLVGEEASARGTKPFSAAFTLVYQKLAGEWKIVHVQDSSRLEAPTP